MTVLSYNEFYYETHSAAVYFNLRDAERIRPLKQTEEESSEEESDGEESDGEEGDEESSGEKGDEGSDGEEARALLILSRAAMRAIALTHPMHTFHRNHRIRSRSVEQSAPYPLIARTRRERTLPQRRLPNDQSRKG